MKDKETNNETVAEAIVAVRKMIHDCPAIKGGLGELRYQLKANGAINIIEEAHDREIKALEWKIENYAKVVECKDREIKAKDAEIAKHRERIKAAEEFATEMKESTNSLVRACGHQMILRLRGEGANDEEAKRNDK